MKAGWEIRPLGEVCAFENGDRGKNYPGRKCFVPKGVPFINAGLVDDGQILWENMNYIPEERFALLSRGKLKSGDFLFCLRGSLGKFGVYRSSQPAAIASSLVIIRTEANLLPEYFSHYLRSDLCAAEISRLAAGAAQPNLGANDLKTFEIPIPPLEEQKRIVAVLDAAFEGLTRAKENAEANLQNARELFESGLEDVLERACEDGIHATLGNVCEFVGGSQPPKSEFLDAPSPDAIRLIQIRDYKSNDKAVYIPKNLARRFCAADDVMIGRYGPPLFQILRGIEGSYNVALMKAVPDPSLITKDFLYYFLRNKKILRYIVDASDRAAGQIGINKKTIEPYPIAVPSFEIQSGAVKSLVNLEDETSKLVAHAKAKLRDIADLRQSLLQKAFAGELT